MVSRSENKKDLLLNSAQRTIKQESITPAITFDCDALLNDLLLSNTKTVVDYTKNDTINKKLNFHYSEEQQADDKTETS